MMLLQTFLFLPLRACTTLVRFVMFSPICLSAPVLLCLVVGGTNAYIDAILETKQNVSDKKDRSTTSTLHKLSSTGGANGTPAKMKDDDDETEH